MSFDFNADEVFKIAEQIEINGAKFYRSAAEKITDPEKKKLLIHLAEMEDEHIQTFKTMHNQLTVDEKHTVKRLNELYAYYQKPGHCAGIAKHTVDDSRILALQCGGIGNKLGKELLDKFGSLKNIANAGIDDFTTIDKIGKAKAEALYRHFNNGNS